jgi:hypothetical protein
MGSYLDSLRLPYRCWARREPEEGSPLLPAYGSEFDRVLDDSTHVLVLIRDDAIEGFLAENRELLDRKVRVHCSGSLVTPLAQGAHPLMTFTDELYSPARYGQIPFVVERGTRTFDELLPGLPNPHYYLDPGMKPLYHALCVLSGNFTSLLWSKFFREVENQLGLPREAAYPYMEQIFLNLMNSSVDPVTGPLVRRDQGTIDRNLEALKDDPYRNVYEGFLRALGSGDWDRGD